MDRNTDSGILGKSKSRSSSSTYSRGRSPPSCPQKESSTGGRNNRDRPNKNSSTQKSKKELQNNWGSSRSISGRNGETFDGKMLSDNERSGYDVHGSYCSTILASSVSAERKSDSFCDEWIEPNKSRSNDQRRGSHRDRIKENEIPKESYEYRFHKKLALAHSTFQRNQKNKWDVWKWGPKPTGARRGAEDHYTFWRNAYDSYLWEIFDRVAGRINKLKNFSGIEIDFEDFVDFSYEFSSGYITPYS